MLCILTAAAPDEPEINWDDLVGEDDVEDAPVKAVQEKPTKKKSRKEVKDDMKTNVRKTISKISMKTKLLKEVERAKKSQNEDADVDLEVNDEDESKYNKQKKEPRKAVGKKKIGTHYYDEVWCGSCRDLVYVLLNPQGSHVHVERFNFGLSICVQNESHYRVFTK